MMSRVEVIEGYPNYHPGIGTDHLPQCRFLDIVNVPDYDWCNKFSILLCNIRSCRKNFLDFTSYFNDVLLNYECIILVETWLNSECNDLFTIQGYVSYNIYRNNYGGGVRLYVKNTVNVVILAPYTFINDVCEMLSVEVTLGSNKFALCCVYHPPTADHGLNNNFIDQMHQSLMSIRDLGLPLVLGGDLNLNLFNPLRLRYISHFVNCMLELDLLPLTTIPTKYNCQSQTTKYSLLDQFWVSSGVLPNDSYVVPIEIADHFPVAIALNFTKPPNINDCKVRVFNHDNNTLFSHFLHDLIPVMVDENMDTMFDNYYENLFRMYNRAFPVVRRTTSGEDTRDAEWLTPAVKACLKKKSRIYRMYIRGQIHKESYTFYANKVTTLLTKVKRLYYFKLCLRDPRNSTKTWLYINRIIGSTKRGTMVKLTVRGVTLTGAEMANYANEYFVSIANKLTEGIQDNGPYIFLTENNPNTFVMIPTDVLEVLKIINGLINKDIVLLDINVRTIKYNSQVFAGSNYDSL